MKTTKVNIYKYSDYRSYLKDRFTELKTVDKKYSLRFLSKKLGLASNSHLKMVMDGTHNLSIELARKLTEVLRLEKQESDFFVALVKYGQAKNTHEKTEALQELRKSTQFVKLHQVELNQFDYYNNPLTLILRELVSVPDFSEDPEWLASKLPFKVTTKEIENAVAKLLKLELLTRDEKGRLRAKHPHITTGHGFGSVALKGYYLNAFDKAGDCLEIPGTVRHLGGMTMAVSAAAYERIVQHFQQFLNTIRAEVVEDEDPDRIYQLVMAMYPLTRLKELES